MKTRLFIAFAAAFSVSFAATASMNDPIIVCSGGVYCEEERLVCIASGEHQEYCNGRWRWCVLDACPQ